MLAPLCWGLSLPLVALGGEAAQTLVPTELRQQPFSDAPSLGALPERTPVEMLKRQGGWMQVKPAELAPGWLKMSSIKLLGAGAAAKGDSGLSALWNVAAQGRSGQSGITVATGVRGLSSEDMKAAKPAPLELQKLDQYAASQPDAQAFANAAPLTAHKLDYLPASTTTEVKK